MHILIGLIIGCALLYFWLVGNWFARVLVTPILMGAAFFLLASIFVSMAPNAHENVAHQGAAIAAALCAIPLGWALGSLPVWYWRKRIREAEEARIAGMSAGLRALHGELRPRS